MKYIIGLLCLAISIAWGFKDRPECVMFFYGNGYLPEDLLFVYDWIILDQDSSYIEELKDKFYLRKRAKLIAYISLGEIEKHRDYFELISKFAIGENPMWKSLIADLRDSEYLNFIIDVVAERIVEKGFDGFFLDTLDSYKLVADSKDFPKFEEAIVYFVERLRKKYPDKLIILNRGFEVIDRVHKHIDGVVVESLFKGINSEHEYVDIPKAKREYILREIRRIDKYNLPIVVIDYVDPKQKNIAIDTVAKIKSLGFIPYVSDKYLSKAGYSSCTFVPRRVVLLYDSSLYKIRQHSRIHRTIQMPLEYLGFVPELVDINESLPEIYPSLGYFAVIAMNDIKPNKSLDEWLIKIKNEGVKIFFIGGFPFFDKNRMYKEFGLSVKRSRNPFNFNVTKEFEGAGFEVPLLLSYVEYLIVPNSGYSLVEAKDDKGNLHVPFAITEWGGYSVDNTLINDKNLWVYDPFKIFKMILSQKEFPTPDVTTENGRRILTAHIDGDAFSGVSEYVPNKNLGEIIGEEIIQTFEIPHTVSVIEFDIAEKPELILQARKIFSLRNVEPSSHSYSHPFTWQPEYYQGRKFIYGKHLKVEGYELDFEREIKGSVEYINNNLLKGIDKKVSVFLWSGECDPGKNHLRMVYELGIPNVNGGDTSITYNEPFLYKVSPMGVNYEHYFQVYAPIQNENVYTNLWTGPFWGYFAVIQTFELTEKPYRLKPISIYYHFYSAEKRASLNALKEVYKYAVAQDVNPMYLSEYALRVFDYRATAILIKEGGFVIRNSGYLRTVRIPAYMGYPDLKESKGVIGYKKEGNVIYIHLDGSGESYVKLIKNIEREFLNVESFNGQISDFIRDDTYIRIELFSYVKPELDVLSEACKVNISIEENKANKEGKYYAKIEATCKP